MAFTITSLIAQPELSLVERATNMTSTISASPGTYGLSAPIASSMSDAAAAFEAAVAAAKEAESAYREAVQLKKAAREALEAQLTTYLPMTLANPTVTNGHLASIGLEPRTPRRAFVSPEKPEELVVSVKSNGYAKFKWSRADNTTNTIYTLQQKTQGGDWANVWSGTRSRVELAGYAPGEEVYFRVIATKGREASEPSTVQVIYPVGGAMQLRRVA